MSKIKTVLKGAVLAFVATIMLAAPSFAACDNVTANYPDLSNAQGGDYNVKCGASFTDNNGQSVQLYGKSQEACSQAGLIASNPSLCDGGSKTDFISIVRTIINTVIFIIGMLAVIMIILGGITYTTSQGDAGKVKKGKDTILYGIVGLIIALLAFPIISFVLNAIQ